MIHGVFPLDMSGGVAGSLLLCKCFIQTPSVKSLQLAAFGLSSWSLVGSCCSQDQSSVVSREIRVKCKSLRLYTALAESLLVVTVIELVLHITDTLCSYQKSHSRSASLQACPSFGHSLWAAPGATELVW